MKSADEIRRILAALDAEVLARAGCDCPVCTRTREVFTIGGNVLSWVLGDEPEGDAEFERLIRSQSGAACIRPASNN